MGDYDERFGFRSRAVLTRMHTSMRARTRTRTHQLDSLRSRPAVKAALQAADAAAAAADAAAAAAAAAAAEIEDRFLIFLMAFQT